MKRNYQKILRILMGRRAMIVLSLLIQLLLLFWMVWSSSQAFRFLAVALNIVSIIAGLAVLNTRSKPGYKIIWCSLILLVPVFGGLFYLLFKFQAWGGKLYRNIRLASWQPEQLLLSDAETDAAFRATLPEHIPQLSYLRDVAHFPLYRNTEAEYLSPGEVKFQRLMAELDKAERFIFLEYFILEEGYMWDSILDLLAKKKAAGLDVRVMYDDVGCLTHLPARYFRQVEKRGIPCIAFNPFRPVWSSDQNNRDHRKIVIIDGNVAFTGGVNLADEYINYNTSLLSSSPVIHPAPAWKDASVMLRGEGVWTLTVLFLQLWNMSVQTKKRPDSMTVADTLETLERFRPCLTQPKAPGFVQPWGDSPVDDEEVAETLYMRMITAAKKTLYIQTPYLIVDDNLLSSLCLAAKSGVDVQIILPAVPDKKIVHATTRTYYLPLMEAGVKIYEYAPGFIHSKIVICDDRLASIGTANLDYRSFCMSFECGTMLYDCPTIAEMQADFLRTVELCHRITEAEMKRNFFGRLSDIILRAVAPLL